MKRIPVVARILGLIVLLACLPAWSQVPGLPGNLSAAQGMKLFKQLSPQQRAAALAALRGKQTGTVPNAPTGEAELPQETPPAEVSPQTLPEEETVTRIQGGDTLIVSFHEQEDAAETGNTMTQGRQPEHEALRLQVDPPVRLFKLDEEGVLDFPPVGRIPLAGLDEEQAAARLMVEPLLAGYEIQVQRLPLQPVGAEALRPFGYDFFEKRLPAEVVPPPTTVPADYLVGPGDVLQVQLFGKENDAYELEVDREGRIHFPGIGPIPVAGLTFRELKRDLRARVKRQFLGVEASVALARLRTIQVYVLGEVRAPGAYVVNALTDMSAALLRAGGVSEQGSLRRIRLVRGGREAAVLDFYDLLLRGDKRHDLRLQDGDVIHVPAVGDTVALVGEVKRPAIYELDGERDLASVLALAGGPTAEAYLEAVKVERITPEDGKRILDVDLTRPEGRGFQVKNGDRVRVYGVAERKQSVVFLEGHVQRPTWYQWHPGMRLSDLVPDEAMLKPGADLEYVLIQREHRPGQTVEALSARLSAAWREPGGADDPPLEARDRVIVFDLSDHRALLLDPLIRRLKAQALAGEPAQVVRINGQVRAPGSYPLEAGMRVSDLVRAGGRLKESAYLMEAELTRFRIEKGLPREIDHLRVDLAAALSGNPEADLVLRPYDVLTVKEVPQWEEQDLVTVEGEVRFPGTYPIRRGETLGQLLERAGGLTPFAYPEGAVFMREELRRREQERMEAMAANLEEELAAMTLESRGDPAQAQSITVVRQLIRQVRSTRAAGRLVIDLTSEDSPTTRRSLELVLKGGDRLYIPSKMQEVTVIGEVFHPTSHLYRKGLGWRDYVDLSGGMTHKADDDRVYVVRANGSVETVKGRWFARRSIDIRPGDTIVVPLDAERIRPLRLWTDVSQILYQLGIAAASWKTVGLF